MDDDSCQTESADEQLLLRTTTTVGNGSEGRRWHRALIPRHDICSAQRRVGSWSPCCFSSLRCALFMQRELVVVVVLL